MFDFDDVYEIGAEIAVGSVTDNEIAKNISSIIGTIVGARLDKVKEFYGK